MHRLAFPGRSPTGSPCGCRVGAAPVVEGDQVGGVAEARQHELPGKAEVVIAHVRIGVEVVSQETTRSSRLCQ